MTGMWGPTGPFVPEDVKLSSDAKDQINQIILDNGLSVSDSESFFDEIDKALSQYKGYARFRQEGLPATVRKNLKKAAEVSKNLNAHINNNLDGNSRQLWAKPQKGVSMAFGPVFPASFLSYTKHCVAPKNIQKEADFTNITEFS